MGRVEDRPRLRICGMLREGMILKYLAEDVQKWHIIRAEAHSFIRLCQLKLQRDSTTPTDQYLPRITP